MTAVITLRNSTPNTASMLTVPLSQNTALVHEFRCLFTHDIRRKNAKRWHDGILKFHTFNKRAMLYDYPDQNYVGDSHVRDRDELEDGDEMSLERGGVLIQVGEKINTKETDLTAILVREKKIADTHGTHGQLNQKRSNAGILSTRHADAASRSSISYPPTQSRSRERPIILPRSPFEERNLAQLEGRGEDGPLTKRRRNDENHLPLWEILKTSKMSKSTPVAKKTMAVADPKRSKPHGNLAASMPSLNGQARLKVKELIILDSSLPESQEESTMPNQVELESHITPHTPKPATVPPPPKSIEEPLLSEPSMSGDLVQASENNRLIVKRVTRQIDPSVAVHGVSQQEIGEAQSDTARRQRQVRPPTHRLLKSNSIQAKTCVNLASQHSDNLNGFEGVDNLGTRYRPEYQAQDTFNIPLNTNVDLAKSLLPVPIHEKSTSNSEPNQARPLRLATAPRRKMLLCQDLPPARLTSKTTLARKRKDTIDPEIITRSSDILDLYPNDRVQPEQPHLTDRTPNTYEQSGERFDPPIESESRSHLTGPGQVRDSLAAISRVQLNISKSADQPSVVITTTSKETVQRCQVQDQPVPPEKAAVQQIEAAKPAALRAVARRQPPRTVETQQLLRQIPIAQGDERGKLEPAPLSPKPTSLGAIAASGDPEAFPAIDAFPTAGPWTIEAWDLFGWLPPGREGLQKA